MFSQALLENEKTCTSLTFFLSAFFFICFGECFGRKQMGSEGNHPQGPLGIVPAREHAASEERERMSIFKPQAERKTPGRKAEEESGRQVR